jgi:hypothetical protein
MAVRNDSSFQFTNADLTNFHAWCSFIDALFKTNGLWVDTAATGSIDLTSVAIPTVINTSSGYKVYRMADTLQATAPVFIKVEFGSGAGVTFPSLWFTVGTTHDGLGNIGNVLLTRVQNQVAAAGSTPNGLNFGSADTNRCCFVMQATSPGGSTNTSLWFSIERTKDSSGADTNAGFIVGYGAYTIRHVSAYLPNVGLVPPTTVGLHCLLSYLSPSAFNGDVGVAAMIPMATAPQQPGMNVILVRASDFIAGASPVISVYGVNHLYAHCGILINTMRAVSTGGLDDANVRLCLRYE